MTKQLVDAIIVKDNSILLIKREHQPFKNAFCLIGGKIENGESSRDAVIREVKEETDLDVVKCMLLNIYAGKTRDPRGPSESFAYVCECIGDVTSSDEGRVSWHSLNDIKKLNIGFDHRDIISDYKLSMELKNDVCSMCKNKLDSNFFFMLRFRKKDVYFCSGFCAYKYKVV